MTIHDDNVIFTIPQRRFSFSEKDIRINLERFAKDFKIENRTAGTFNKWREKTVSLSTVTRMFGSFENACKQFSIAVGGKKDRYSDDEVLVDFERLWRWRGQPPSHEDFKKYKLEVQAIVSIDVIKRRFGSYTVFCKNFSDYKRKIISKAELLAKSKPVRLRKPISDHLRFELIKTANNRCQECGESPKSNQGITLEIDHILPFSKGGSDDRSNLRVLCNLCNRGRSDRYGE